MLRAVEESVCADVWTGKQKHTSAFRNGTLNTSREQYARASARANRFLEKKQNIFHGKKKRNFLCFSSFCGLRGLAAKIFLIFLESASAFSSLSQLNLWNFHRFGNHCDGRLLEREGRDAIPLFDVVKFPAVCREISGNSKIPVKSPVI